MGECLITRRGGEAYKLPVLDSNYPKDITTTVIKGNSTSASFSVSISSAGNPAEYTYKWYENGSVVSGATSSTYTKSGITETGTYSIYCEITNKAGTVTSRVATLKVTQYYTPVLNSSYPANVSTNVIDSATTNITLETKISTAGSPSNYTYQWYWDGSAVSGATSSSYTRTNVAAGSYTAYCKVTNAAGTVTSRTATITIAKYTKPVLNGSYPTNVTSVEKSSSSATFKIIVATAGNPASYTYQWYWNGSAVSGATSSSYTRSGYLSPGSYSVYCKVTNAAGTVQSRTATWVIKNSAASVSSGSISITKNGYNWDGVVTGTTTLTFSNFGTGGGSVDVFLVGGGGGGGHAAGGGGGGGYTATQTLTLKEGVAYTFEVGAGGAKSTNGNAKASQGGTTSIKQGSTVLAAVAGGYGGQGYNGDGTERKRTGGAGGSGGGGGGGNGDGYGENDWAGSGGSNGGNGTSSTGYGGSGQGSTTYGFGSSAYGKYSGGGAGGRGGYKGNNGSPGDGGGGYANSNGGTNTGGGGGGGTHDIETTYAGNGGSGIILIRNHR